MANATEKLLQVIRGKSPDPGLPAMGKGAHQIVSLRTGVRHGLTAGIFIDETHLSLALSGRQKKSGAPEELIQWLHQKLPVPPDFENETFVLFLKNTLTGFLKDRSSVALWTALDTRDLKLRNFSIPDVDGTRAVTAALWGMKKEFELEESKEILDFEVLGKIQSAGITKKQIVAYTGDRARVEQIASVFAGIGFPLTGITPIPFALQNFIRCGIITPGQGPLVVVSITPHFSDIFCFSGPGLLLTRTIRTGSLGLIEEYLESADSSPNPATVPDILTPELTADSEIYRWIEPAALRLIGKITRTGDYCTVNYAENQPVSEFLFLGDTDDCPAFLKLAADQIPTPVAKLTPRNLSDTALTLTLPETAQERGGVLPAFGLSLSCESRTPNLLQTWSQKIVRNKYRRLDLAIAVTCALCLLCCGALWAWLNMAQTAARRDLSTIDRNLAEFDVLLDQKTLVLKIAHTRRKALQVEQYVQDYLVLAVIRDISTRTPDTIAISHLEADLSVDESRTDPDAAVNKKLTLTGVASPGATAPESELNGYAIRLGDSLLIRNIQIRNQTPGEGPDTGNLRFTADMEIPL